MKKIDGRRSKVSDQERQHIIRFCLKHPKAKKLVALVHEIGVRSINLWIEKSKLVQTQSPSEAKIAAKKLLEEKYNFKVDDKV